MENSSRFICWPGNLSCLAQISCQVLDEDAGESSTGTKSNVGVNLSCCKFLNTFTVFDHFYGIHRIKKSICRLFLCSRTKNSCQSQIKMEQSKFLTGSSDWWLTWRSSPSLLHLCCFPSKLTFSRKPNKAQVIWWF